MTELREWDDGVDGMIVETADGTELPVERHERTEEHVDIDPCGTMLRMLA